MYYYLPKVVNIFLQTAASNSTTISLNFNDFLMGRLGCIRSDRGKNNYQISRENNISTKSKQLSYAQNLDYCCLKFHDKTKTNDFQS